MSESARDHVVSVNGLRLHYREWGRIDRQPVVLLHASGCHAHWWNGIGPILAESYRLIAPDLRGHGESGRPEPPDYSYEAYVSDLEGLLKVLDLKDFLLVGHSLGGGLSLKYASTRPPGLTALVGIDLLFEISGEALERLHQSSTRPSPLFTTRQEAEGRFHLQPPETAAPDEVLQNLSRQAVFQTSDGSWTFRFDRRALKQSSFRIWDLLPFIECPVLVVHGELSDIMPATNAEKVAMNLKKGEWATIPGAYHNIMLDNPVGLVQVLREFFSRAGAK